MILLVCTIVLIFILIVLLCLLILKQGKHKSSDETVIEVEIFKAIKFYLKYKSKK